MTTEVTYVMPNGAQKECLDNLVRRLKAGIVPTAEVHAIEDQVPSTYLNLHHVGGRGYLPVLQNIATDLWLPLERTSGGYTGRRES